MPPAQHQIPRGIHQMVSHLHDTPLFVTMILPKFAAPIRQVFLDDESPRDEQVPGLGQPRLDGILRRLEPQPQPSVNIDQRPSIDLTTPGARRVNHATYPRATRLDRLGVTRRFALPPVMLIIEHNAS